MGGTKYPSIEGSSKKDAKAKACVHVLKVLKQNSSFSSVAPASTSSQVLHAFCF